MKTYSPVAPGEAIIVSIGFRKILASGESMTDCVFKVYDATTGDVVTGVLVGAPDPISAWPKLKQKVTGKAAGDTYVIEATLTTNKRVLKGYAKLPVTHYGAS